MNNKTALSVFTFQNHPVRTSIIDDEIWFVVSDACKVLDIINVSQAVDRLDQDGVCTTEVIDSMGRKQNATIANEPNLYRLIFQSRKPDAKAFQDWVYKEVLPSIRKTGEYSTQSSQLAIQQFAQSRDLEKIIKDLRKEMRDIKQLITPLEKQPVSRQELKERVIEAIRDMQEDYPDGLNCTEIKEGYPWFSQRNHSTDLIWHIINKLVEQGLIERNTIRRQIMPHHFREELRYRLPKGD
jgi:prophage antirepressor-like protein